VPLATGLSLGLSVVTAAALGQFLLACSGRLISELSRFPTGSAVAPIGTAVAVTAFARRQ
jgi:hypothetical protein